MACHQLRINNNGQVLDTSQTRSGQSRAFSWNASGFDGRYEDANSVCRSPL
ncbi:hypothetical protein [Ralstonia solanacearum]|uniref:hypothetical protein n=1 Tax=Ralstonia solanacearum TaxID=305 RepID=UPI0018CFF691